MKFKGISLLAILSSWFLLPSSAQQSDPIIMTIAGKPVKCSEFLYSYEKNNGHEVIDQKTVEEYVELFANYKRKVQAALDAHLDTLTSYNEEFRKYRDMQVMPTLINDDDVEVEARKIYDSTKESIGPDGLVQPQHILFYIGQNPADGLQETQRQRADSAYQAILNGADFEELAKSISQDPGTASRGGDIGWVQHGQLLKGLDDKIFTMNPGEVSKPILTEVGYHILKIKGRKQLEPYDSLRNKVYDYIRMRQLRSQFAKNRLKALAETKGLTEQQVMDQRADSISAIDNNMKYLIQEYHDGLLLFEISNREVWEKASKDENALKALYKKNRKKYTWDEPRFKGMAYRTQNEGDIEAVKQSVKGKPFEQWADILRSTFNNDSVIRIRVEKGLFKKGANPIVDRNEFGVADAEVKQNEKYPYTATFGKLLTAPEELNDVRANVVADYQEILEKQWVSSLEKKYPMTLDKKVLQAVKEKIENNK